MSSSFTPHPFFNILSFQPHQVLLQQHSTKTVYRYQAKRRSRVQFDLNHDSILVGLPYKDGLIYEKELWSLSQCLEQRMSRPNKQSFQTEEIINTFENLLKYFQQGNKYDCLSAQSIVIDKNQKIKLKDPRLKDWSHSNKDCFRRLGTIILQCLALREESKIEKLTLSKAGFFCELRELSPKMRIATWVLLTQGDNICNRLDLKKDDLNLGEFYLKQQKQFKTLSEITEIKEGKQNNIERQNIERQENSRRGEKRVQFNPQRKIVVIPPLNLMFNVGKRSEVIRQRGQTKEAFERRNPQQAIDAKERVKKIRKVEFEDSKTGPKNPSIVKKMQLKKQLLKKY